MFDIHYFCANLYTLLEALLEAQCQDNGTKLLSFVSKYQKHIKVSWAKTKDWVLWTVVSISRLCHIDYQIDSDIDFRNGTDRLRRSRSRVEDITDARHTRRSRSRQSHEGNHLVYNPSNIPPITDTSDAENPHSGQPYNNLNGRLGQFYRTVYEKMLE